MNLKLTLSPRHTVLAAVLWLLAGNPMWGGTLTLEGQNKGDTNNW